MAMTPEERAKGILEEFYVRYGYASSQHNEQIELIAQAIREAVEEEREDVAKHIAEVFDDYVWSTAVVQVIRARSGGGKG
jgi:hypothetical protein